ncbi:MAG TPA: hypothetical protein EYP73_08115 [Acidimicrobiia bacterium]|nr:hypothetical protein [Acidimicrobiia bacterium]
MKPILPDHGGLTSVPQDLGVSCPPQRSLGVTAEPATLPPLLGDDDDPLVEVDHSRVIYLAAYHRAQLPQAAESCLLRASAVHLLYRAAESLPEGYGLGIFDGWRHPGLQAYLAAACPDPRYVTPPDDPASRPPPHTTGGAVDLTLTAGESPLALGTSFDHFGPEAAIDAFERQPGPVRELRRMLYWAMVEVGFAPYASEWWHFEYGTRRWAAHTGREPRFGPVFPART